MLTYEKKLKCFARDLRKNMPPAEALLWSRLREKQVLDMRFNRQKLLLNYIVDFYCHQAKLVIEYERTIKLKKNPLKLDTNNLSLA